MLDETPTATLTPSPCPRCGAAALVATDASPTWCAACEWNLEVWEPARNAGWFSRAAARLNHRAGFRADARLAAGTALSERRSGSQILLRVISALLVLVPVACVALGVWLVIRYGGAGVVPAVPLCGIAWGLRPRLGSVRRAARGGLPLKRVNTPLLHHVVDQIAATTGAPPPHLLVLDFSDNASAAVVGLRRRRVVRLGIPLLASLRPQELVALLAHELGHLKYADSTNSLLTQPACLVFGTLARVVRGPGIPSDGHFLLAVWKLIGVPLSYLLWTVHLGLNLLDARDIRRAELRADLLSVKAAGSAGVLGLLDAIIISPRYGNLISHTAVKGSAVADWRRYVERVRDRDSAEVPLLRQLSNRMTASLFASHPAPGRRHQIIATMPSHDAGVVLTEGAAARLDAELSPYAEWLRAELAGPYE